MIQVIERQGNSWHMTIHGVHCTFTKTLQLYTTGLLPLKADTANGLRWRVNRKWVSYRQIKSNMKTIIPIIAIMLTTATFAQVRPYAGIGAGYMSNTKQISTELKLGVMIEKASVEGSVAFSPYVPHQRSIRVGYQFGKRLYLTPQAGRLWHFYGNGKATTSQWSYGAEIGYIFDMDGTNGEGLDVRLTLGYFGNYGGVSLRVGL